MLNFQKAILLLVFLIQPCIAGQVFRCEKDKKILYQDSPCAKQFKQKILNADTIPQVVENKEDNTVPQSSVKSVSTPKTNKAGTIVLQRDPDSHFYIDGFVNGVAVSFLVDTGASIVAIPSEIIAELGLVQEMPVQVKSASGVITAYQTTIKELTLQDFVFKDVIAQTMEGNQPLLGMNILRQFDITQKDDQLILTYQGP